MPVDRVIFPHHTGRLASSPPFLGVSFSAWGLHSKSKYATLSRCKKFHKILGKKYSQSLLSLKMRQRVSGKCMCKWNKQWVNVLFKYDFKVLSKAIVFTDKSMTTPKLTSLANITNQNTISVEMWKTPAWSLYQLIFFKFMTKMLVELMMELLITFAEAKLHCVFSSWPKLIIESG